MIGDQTATRTWLRRWQRLAISPPRGNNQRAIVLLHRALTGKAGAVKASGFTSARALRNSRFLHGWTRAQINIAPGSADNNDALVITCGKNSNSKEFAPLQ